MSENWCPKCHVFVHRIAVHDDEDPAEFDAELQEMAPSARFVPLALILD